MRTPHAARCTSVVVNPFFDWGEDHRPRIPYHETVLYEVHVKGMTIRHPGIPSDMQGTYAGPDAPADDQAFSRPGGHRTRTDAGPAVRARFRAGRPRPANYWGYNTIGFFAPHNEYVSPGTRGQQVQEFKTMVRSLHRAGIEVILDVVYNHTAEGNHLGPTLSFRGIDNAAYYRLVTDEPQYYYDTTGTGNSLNVRHPDSLQLLMDSLRYWITEMHVDGFRFDLARSLAREFHAVDRLSAFFDLINQDPVVSQVKLIAEPWDIGPGGYQVGRFPPHCGRSGTASTATRCATSGAASPPAWPSSPPGSPAPRTCTRATAADPAPRSTSSPRTTASPWPTWSPTTTSTTRTTARTTGTGRATTGPGTAAPKVPPRTTGSSRFGDGRQRNLLATLLLSQGVPMLAHGDELGRTQCGNNNAYCQDNAVSWIDWDAAGDNQQLTAFTAQLLALRAAHPVFRRRRFFQGRPIRGSSTDDIAWLRPDGKHMTDHDWADSSTKALAVFLNGQGIPDHDEFGERVVDDSFLLLINAYHRPIVFTMPDESYGQGWAVVLDTADPLPTRARRRRRAAPQGRLRVRDRAMLVLRHVARSLPSET